MNINQYNLTKYNPAKPGSKENDRATTAGDDADQVDTAQQFGDRIDLIFPDLWKEQKALHIRDLVEKVGSEVACALLGDAIGAKVSYDKDKGLLSWGKAEGIRYQPDGIFYMVDVDHHLGYDESGHLVPPVRWHNDAGLSLACGFDLTHGYRSDFAFVKVAPCDEGHSLNGAIVVMETTDVSETTHLLIRSFWGGPHSTTRGMLDDQLEQLMADGQLTFYRKVKSNSGGEGVDYFCVPVILKSSPLYDRVIEAYLNSATNQNMVEEEFWKRHLQVTTLRNDYAFLKVAYAKMQLDVESCLKQMRVKAHSTEEHLLCDPLLHLPDHASMTKMKELKCDEEYYACSAEELEGAVCQQKKQQEEILTYTAKFKRITKNWLDYAKKFFELNKYLQDGWVEVFGEAAVVTFPKQNSVAILTLHAATPGKMDYEQTVFPLSAGALSEATILIHDHLKEVKTNQRAAQMAVAALETLCTQEDN